MRKIVIILMLLLFAYSLFAVIPDKKEELIYVVQSFNGTGYSGTFIRGDADTIYMLADMESFVLVRKSLVYFWPLTREWKLDTQALSVTFDGYLQIDGDNMKTKTYHMQDFTLSIRSGKYESGWQVHLGDEIEVVVREFEQVVKDYEQRMEKFNLDKMLYEQYTNILVDKIRQAKAAGQDVTGFLEEAENMKVPEDPEIPDYYVDPVKTTFVVKLPAGTYKIRFLDEEGRIMEGSEKKLVVFNKRRANGIGYDVVPEDKWTKLEKSFTPSSVLYVDGTTPLYFKPFFEEEYNDLFYNKMLINDSEGNQNVYRWEELTQVPDARMEVSNDRGVARIITEKSFIIEQGTGRSLGYKIVPFDPEGAHKRKTPGLIAFYVPISFNDRFLKIKLQTGEGESYPLSFREIRIKPKIDLSLLLYLFAILPLIVCVVVVAVRKRNLHLR